MQMTEDLIRSVVQQVLTQMGGMAQGPAGAGNGAVTVPRPAGTLGVYASADDAVAAAAAAFHEFRTRPLADRAKAVNCVRSICVEQAEELGRLELEETKIGRLDHKIAKLRDAIP